MPREVDDRQDQRRSFGEALKSALTVKRVTQRELGELLGVSQPAISAWITGEAEPDPTVVFLTETALDVQPGSLSKLLGYLPTAAVKNVANFEAAVMEDPRLSVDAKNALLGAYRAVIAGPGRAGRPRRS